MFDDQISLKSKESYVFITQLNSYNNNDDDDDDLMLNEHWLILGNKTKQATSLDQITYQNILHAIEKAHNFCYIP